MRSHDHQRGDEEQLEQPAVDVAVEGKTEHVQRHVVVEYRIGDPEGHPVAPSEPILPPHGSAEAEQEAEEQREQRADLERARRDPDLIALEQLLIGGSLERQQTARRQPIHEPQVGPDDHERNRGSSEYQPDLRERERGPHRCAVQFGVPQVISPQRRKPPSGQEKEEAPDNHEHGNSAELRYLAYVDWFSVYHVRDSMTASGMLRRELPTVGKG